MALSNYPCLGMSVQVWPNTLTQICTARKVFYAPLWHCNMVKPTDFPTPENSPHLPATKQTNHPKIVITFLYYLYKVNNKIFMALNVQQHKRIESQSTPQNNSLSVAHLARVVTSTNTLLAWVYGSYGALIQSLYWSGGRRRRRRQGGVDWVEETGRRNKVHEELGGRQDGWFQGEPAEGGI